MKKNVLILLTIIMSYTLMAQQKQKEVGLVFNNLNNFGLSYKTGTNKALWRFNTMFISGYNINSSSDRDSISDVNNENLFGFGISMGREFRKTISSNFEFRFGADLSFNYRYEKNKRSNNISIITTYQPGVNLVLGFNYLLNDNFSIGAELLPNFTYSTSKTEYNNSQRWPVTTSGYSYGISNNSVLLCLAYKF